ncbi:MAG: hypothetical protein HY595_02700, partial [Candidatus Omnitrophica bacterium]|nr:hypothetical protein [Candidatus Omnitrophota bacterium]
AAQDAALSRVEGLRCGLGIIKNVGMAAIDSIITARAQRERFTTIEELCQDIDLRLANRKVLESLIKAGACDSMGKSRAALLAGVDQALEEAQQRQRDKSRGQLTFFDALSAAQETAETPRPNLGVMREWPESQKLAFEKTLLGFYVSGHPLARFEKLLRLFSTATSRQLAQLTEETQVTVGGLLTKVKLTTTKKTNEQMAVCLMEDLEGEIEVLVFPASFAQLAPQLKVASIIFVEGRASLRDDRPRVVAQQIVPLEQGTARLTKAIELILRSPGLERDLLEQLKNLLTRFPGTIPVYFKLNLPAAEALSLKLAEAFKIDPHPELLDELGKLLGDDGVVIRRQPLVFQRVDRFSIVR